jgi:hypothetical protein
VFIFPGWSVVIRLEHSLRATVKHCARMLSGRNFSIVYSNLP